MKGLRLSAETKKTKKVVAAPRKRVAATVAAPAHSARRYGVLMPGKLALANKMLAETPVPLNLFEAK